MVHANKLSCQTCTSSSKKELIGVLRHTHTHTHTCIFIVAYIVWTKRYPFTLANMQTHLVGVPFVRQRLVNSFFSSFNSFATGRHGTPTHQPHRHTNTNQTHECVICANACETQRNANAAFSV